MEERMKSFDERIKAIENKLKAIEELLRKTVLGVVRDSESLEYFANNVRSAKDVIKQLYVTGEDSYYKVISRPTLVVLHDPTEGKAKVIGYFAGVHPISGKVMVCQKVIKQEQGVQLINVKQLPISQSAIVNKNLEDSNVIILDPLYAEHGFIGEREIAEMAAQLAALKQKNAYLASELTRYKYLYNFLNEEVRRLGDELTKVVTQLNAYQAERARMLAQLREVTGKLQAMYNYVIELEKIVGEKYKVKFESMRSRIDEMLQDLQDTFQLELETVTSMFERLKQDLMMFKQRLLTMQPSPETQEILARLDEILNKLEQKKERGEEEKKQ